MIPQRRQGFRFPRIIEERLENGLTLLWVPDREQPAVTITAQIASGRFSDPSGHEGLMDLTISLLQKNTNDLTCEQVSQRFEQVGAALFHDVGDEHSILGFRALSRFVPSVLPLFFEMLTHPRFQESELKRLKREAITSIQAERNDPSFLAGRHFYSDLCGSGHPAGRTHTSAGLRSIRLSDIERFYGRSIHPRNTVLVIAGDIDPDALRETYRDFWEGWSGTGSDPFRAPGVERVEQTRIRLIDKRDISQAYLVLGHPVPGELHEARNALAVANYILGGGNFSSRLMTSIRTTVGQTYSIGSQIAWNLHYGIFSISTATQTSRFPTVLGNILKTYRDLEQCGITDQELDQAKQYAVGSMAFQLEGINNIVEKLLWLRLYGRPTSYIESMPEVIHAITIDQVGQAVRESLSSKGFVISVVGRKQDLLPELMKYGPVEIYTPRSGF